MLSKRLRKIVVILLVLTIKHVHTTERNCEDDRDARVRFIDPVYGMQLERKHQARGRFPSFADIRYFSKQHLDFQVTQIDPDELYSVIMMQQGTYARLEPDGQVRLKWFVSNISGGDLRRGKKHWGGLTLAEFEPMIRRNLYEFNLLWIFKHVDNATILEDLAEDRNRFVLQNYYNYLCSKPVMEVIFLERKHVNQAKSDIGMAKRLVN